MKFLIFAIFCSGIFGLLYLAKLSVGKKPEHLYDLVEQSAYRLIENPLTTLYESRAKSILGYCETGTSPGEARRVGAETGAVAFTARDVLVLADRRVPFTIPFRLNDFSVLCLYPSSPKVFMIAGDAVITLRREFDSPPIVQVSSGETQLTSEKANLILRTAGMDITLVSEGPARLGISNKEGRLSLMVLVGKLSMSYRIIPDSKKSEELHIFSTKDGTITMEGKPLPMQNNMAILLPSGFQELPPQAEPSLPPPVVAPPPMVPQQTAPVPSPQK